MPFGLRNAPPTFQRAMARALAGCEHCAVVYIDDILIFSKDRQEHLSIYDSSSPNSNNPPTTLASRSASSYKRKLSFWGIDFPKEGSALIPTKSRHYSNGQVL